IVRVDTPVGAVRFKLAWREGRIVNAVPEFEDCQAIARARNLSVKDVQAIALHAYGGQRAAPTPQPSGNAFTSTRRSITSMRSLILGTRIRRWSRMQSRARIVSWARTSSF